MNDELRYFNAKELDKTTYLVQTDSKEPTNGDMIQALFEGLEVEFVEDVPLVRTNLDGTLVTFCASWWNAPYTGKGGER